MGHHHRSRIHAVFIFLGLLVAGLLASTTATASEGYGVVLGADAPDLALSVRNLGSAICYIDGDGNNAYGAGEPVILRTTGGCSGSSSGRDIRLNAWDGLEPGRRLAADADANKPLSSPPTAASFWFYDANGNGRMDHGDTGYANIVNGASGFVDAGDVRLAPFQDLSAGSVVASGDPDLSFGLTLLGAPSEAVALVDSNDNGLFDRGDLLYLNSDLGDNELVEFGDLRITPLGADRPFGSFVRFGDPDGSAFYTMERKSPCYTDVDGSGSYTPGDGLFLDIVGDCQGSVGFGDIRLVAQGDHDAGTRVGATDPDTGGSMAKIADAYVAYSDLDQDGRFGPRDIYYLDLVSTGSTQIDPGDVRLTPVGGRVGGFVFRTGDPEIGQRPVRLGLFADRVGFLSLSGGTSPTISEPIYLNLDGLSGEGVEPGDVRLVQLGDLPFGGSATLATREVLPRLASPVGTLCVSASDQGGYKLGDAAYLSFSGCPSNAATGMLRLTEVGGRPPGSTVGATDPDSGAAITTAAGQQLKFFDADGDGDWSAGDLLYADLVSTGSNRVDVGDVRLVATSSLTDGSVRAQDSDVNMPLTVLGNVGSHTRFVDSNNDGLLSHGDVPYVDSDGAGQYVSLLDVRLAPLPALPEPARSPEPEPSPSLSPSPTDVSPSPSPSPTQTEPSPTPSQTLTDAPEGDDGDDGADGEPPRTPGPAIVLVLAAIGAVLWLSRRS